MEDSRNANVPTSHLVPELHLRSVPTALIEALKTRFAERCSTALVVREQHGRDESSFEAPPPAAVVFAESTQDVADAVKLASQYSVPVIPFGVGTSLEGHLLAVQGGISIDLSHMNQVLAINAEDLTVTVQPGVTRKQLNEAVKSTGLFFPIDPGADATLGVITEVTVKLYPLPEAVMVATCAFGSLADAVNTTIQIILNPAVGRARVGCWRRVRVRRDNAAG